MTDAPAADAETKDNETIKKTRRDETRAQRGGRRRLGKFRGHRRRLRRTTTATPRSDRTDDEVEDKAEVERKWSCLPTYGIALTVLGVVLLDCCCDACQSPCRTYLLDVSQPEDHAAGLATFTVMAGLGGSVGYLFGGVVDWQTTGLGSRLGGHVQVVRLLSINSVDVITY